MQWFSEHRMSDLMNLKSVHNPSLGDQVYLSASHKVLSEHRRNFACFLLLTAFCFPAAMAADAPVVASGDSATATVAADATSADRTVQTTALVRVGVYDHSSGTAKGPKSLGRFLVEESGFQCQKLTPADIQAGKLAEVDVLIMPGGSGSAQANNLGEEGREAVREFVRRGGGYVGICAGSYLASSNYTWSLHLINAQVVDREHWARGTGTATLRLSESGKMLLSEPEDEIDVYYGQGPLLAPDDKVDLPSYEVLAEYVTEIAKKGAPTGVMIGTTAIARAPFGNGRVICYSPHPEVASGPNHLMLHGVRWAAGVDSDLEKGSK
jgi:glutamine amidotransferase-like uncharacterized protein